MTSANALPTFLPTPRCGFAKCSATEQKVRLVRHLAAIGKVRVLMTNLLDTAASPSACSVTLTTGAGASKRLKHRLNLEHLSGLSPLAAMQDFIAKILCDNPQALACAAAANGADLPQEHRINRAYAQTVLKPLLPALLLGRLSVEALQQALALIARQTSIHRPGCSKPRHKRDKPHRHMRPEAVLTCTAKSGGLRGRGLRAGG